MNVLVGNDEKITSLTYSYPLELIEGTFRDEDKYISSKTVSLGAIDLFKCRLICHYNRDPIVYFRIYLKFIITFSGLI